MNKLIFVNLPVRELPKSKAFFESLGYKCNPQFTDDTAACLVISETIFAMLLTHPKFQGFAPKAICDTMKANEALLALSCESRDEVDTLVKKAVAAGGKTYNKPTDYGYMYTHGFLDLDNHVWELVWMDPSAIKSN